MVILNITFGNKNLYIGQTIYCTSFGSPPNASSHSVELMTNRNFDTKYKNTSNFLYFHLLHEIGLCIIKCSVVFTFLDNRPQKFGFQKFNFNMKCKYFVLLYTFIIIYLSRKIFIL